MRSTLRAALWPALLGAAVLTGTMLGFYGTSSAAQRTGGQPPFANAVEQRMEMISLLREIRDLLKEQNALLRSGELKVQTVESQDQRPTS